MRRIELLLPMRGVRAARPVKVPDGTVSDGTPSDATPSCRPTPSAAGYSLIEVLAAAALLAGVLVSIMGMFAYGGQSVNAGKLMTKATSISNDVLEQFRQLSYRQAYNLIEDGANPAVDTRYVWNSTNNLPNYPDDASYQAMLADWKSQVETQLPFGQMTITIRGIRDLGSNPPEETFTVSRVLQIVVTIRWRERKRDRSVVFETLKV